MKTIKVRKRNKTYQIPEKAKTSYLANGYDVIDEKGKVKERGNQPTVKRVKELEAEIADLQKKNEELTAENKQLKSKKQETKKQTSK